MALRRYQPHDAPHLARIYRESVLAIAHQGYTPDQVQAWAGFADDLPAFAARLEAGVCLVATMNDHPVAFGQLAPADYLAFLYTCPHHMRRGLASTLYNTLEQHARQAGSTAITTHASLFSRPVFERQGFKTIEVEHVIRQGVTFERYVMRKSLNQMP